MRKLFFIVVLVLQAAFTHVVYSDEVLGYQDTIYGGYDVGISFRSSMENYALVLYDFYTDEISYYVLTNKKPFEWNRLGIDVISIDPDIVLSQYNVSVKEPYYHYHIFDVDNRKLIDSLEVDAKLIENSIDESGFYLHHYDKSIEKISLDKDFRIKKSERIGSKCQSVIWGYDNEGLFVIKDQHEYFIYSKYDYSLLYRISDFCVSSIYFSKESDYPVLKSTNNQYYLLTTNEVEQVTKKIPKLIYETNFLNKYIHRIETDDKLYFYAKNEKPFLILDDSLDTYIIGDHEMFNNY